MCIGLVWAFAAILTVAGAYNNTKEQTQVSCRTDRSYLMSSAPWYVKIVVILLVYFSLNALLKIYDYFYVVLILGLKFHIHFNGEPPYSELVMSLG